MNKNIYHTHQCKDLDINSVGQRVTLSGWVATIRDHGGVLFLDLRDNTDTIQVVSNDDNMFRGIAKESVVATMEMLFTDGVAGALSQSAALCLLVFSLLYTPCVAAVASIRREMGPLWAAGVVLWQCLVAWLVSFGVHLISKLF